MTYPQAASASLPLPGQVAGQLPPGQRGRLRLTDRVYTRIAAQAARQALAAAWEGRDGSATLPTVSVLVVRGSARLTLHLELPFPSDVPALARTARDAAVDQVTALTGTPVSDITVTIDRLIPTGPAR